MKKKLLKKLAIGALSLCLIAPAAVSDVAIVNASQISDAVKKDPSSYNNVIDYMTKLSWVYGDCKSQAEFVKLVNSELGANYCTSDDINKALVYLADQLSTEAGKKYSKDESALLMMERMGYPEKFVKDFYTNYKVKASAKVSDWSISVAKAVYKGKAVTPAVTAINGGKKMKKGTDFTVTYKNNKKAGTGTAVIKGKGKYKGTVKVSFTITDPNLDESLPVFSISSAQIVGKDVMLSWYAGSKTDGLSVEILRAESGKNNYKVIGSVGQKSLGSGVKEFYVDKGAGKGKYQYKLRAKKGKKFGKESSAQSSVTAYSKWYKSEDGEYIVMNDWSDGYASFVNYSKDFDTAWHCDWMYEKNGDNTYTVSMNWSSDDGTDEYNGIRTLEVTNDYFKFTDTGKVYKSLNNVQISIE